MAQLQQQHFVIMGGPRTKPTRGLVSTLSDINSEYRDRRLSLDRLKEKAALALGGWQRAMPTYRFELCEVPKQKDYPTYSAYEEAIDKLYEA